jgi:hypothetical protein
MSISSRPPQPLAENELRRRVQDLENEMLMLRSEFEQQSRRMAQLVLENTALKTELGKDPAAREASREAARKANRNRASLVTREEMEYALTMGRGLARPSPETLRRR